MQTLMIVFLALRVLICGTSIDQSVQASDVKSKVETEKLAPDDNGIS